jgi:hypothetical protein
VEVETHWIDIHAPDNSLISNNNHKPHRPTPPMAPDNCLEYGEDEEDDLFGSDDDIPEAFKEDKRVPIARAGAGSTWSTRPPPPEPLSDPEPTPTLTPTPTSGKGPSTASMVASSPTHPRWLTLPPIPDVGAPSLKLLCSMGTSLASHSVCWRVWVHNRTHPYNITRGPNEIQKQKNTRADHQ